MDFGTRIDVLIASQVSNYAPHADVLAVEDQADEVFVASETIGEVIDKLIILNLRVWHLEDQKAAATTDAEMGAIQYKLQSCFRSKRPRLVAALNQMIRAAVEGGRLDLMDDEFVKSYKGDG